MKSLKEYIKFTDLKPNGFCILKPEFLKYSNDFLSLLHNNGWNILDKKELLLSKEQSKELYSPHKGKHFYNDLCNYMSSDKCLCCLCYKNCKNPIEDMKQLKNKIREEWGKDEMKNGMHSSDSLENVIRETKIIF